MKEIILDLIQKISLTELFIIRSKYLFLYLVSWSFSPVFNLGN